MWEKIAAFILRNRLALLFVIGAYVAVMIYGSSKIQMSYDFGKVIPKDDSDFVDYMEFKKMFGEDGNVLVIGVQTDRLYELGFFNAWYDLNEELRKVEGITNVVSMTNLYRFHKNDSLRKFEVMPVVTSKPRNQAEMDSLKNMILGLPFYEGLIINSKANVTLMAISMDKQILDSKKRIAITDQLVKICDKFGQEQQVEMRYSGLPYVRSIFSTKIARELEIFTVLAILVTVIIMWVLFKSFFATFFSLMVVIMGVISTMGTVGFFGYRITLLTGLLPPLIVIIGIQNCIYLLNVYHFDFRKHKNKILALTRITSKNGLGLFLTNATTAVGFGVFNFTGSDILDHFSVVSAINIMVVYVISGIFIPIVFSFLPPPNTRQLKHLDSKRMAGVMRMANNLVYNKRKWIYGVTAVLLLISGFGIARVKTVGYVVDDIPQKDKVYKDLKFFEQHFKGVLPYEITIDTHKKKGVTRLSFLRKMDEFQDSLQKYPFFSRPLSIVELLKFSKQSYYNGNPEKYSMPDMDELSFIMDYVNTEGGENRILKSIMDDSLRVARLSVQMADIGSAEINKLNQELRATADSIFDPAVYTVKLTGTSKIFLKGNDYLIENLTESMIWAFIIISLMMAFLFLSYKMILISLVPNIIPLIMTLGIMGIFNIPLKTSTIIIFSVAYGISIDFTIHYLAKYRHYLRKNNWNISIAIKESLNEAGISIIYTSVILFCGFIIFAGSSFGGTVALGVLTSIALTIGMFTNILLLPAMLLSLEKQINNKKELGRTIVELEEED